MGRFERKDKGERVREILDAGYAAFLEKGYRNTTMEDVIARTSLSKGGFYHYFQSTEQILIALMERETEDAIAWQFADLKGASADTFAERLAQVMIKRILRENPGKDLFAMFVLEMVYTPSLWERYRAIEMDSMEEIRRRYGDEIPLLAGVLSDERFLGFMRLVAGLIITYRLFPEKDEPARQSEYLESMLRGMLEDIVRDAGGVQK